MKFELNSSEYCVLFEIHSFMIDKFKLSGNSLLVYALIFSRSRTEGDICDLTLNEIASCVGATRATVKRVLNDLCTMDLISKKVVTINKVRYCHYKAVDEVVYVKKMRNCKVVSKF